MAKASLSTRLDKHIAADFNPDWAEKAANLMDEAAVVLSKHEERKPVAYIGREKRTQPGKDGPAVHLAFPDSPRSALYEWTALFDA